MALDIVPAELTATLLEVAAYVIYATLAPQAYVVLRKRGYDSLHMKYLHMTFLLTLVAATLHVAFTITLAYEAFSTHTDEAGFAKTYYSRSDIPLCLAKSVCQAIVVVLADALLVFRTFIIWDRSRRVIIFPALFLLVDLAHSALIVVSPSSPNSPLSKSMLSPRLDLVIFVAVSWTLNLLCAGLIAYKICKMRYIIKRLFSTKNDLLDNMLTVILESASIYSVLILATLITTALGNAFQFIVVDLTPPLVGIIFLFVIMSSSNVRDDDTFRQNPTIPISAENRDVGSGTSSHLSEYRSPYSSFGPGYSQQRPHYSS
ncbi:hypothetical protein QCA50_014589 [Cerrena zonata]|uniref:Uncharacterized protein n=1 Tax=Cerrena zonata TaxID=2478898 RepID=A0AAW0FTM1_9APHY